jgi:hypothetical protein
MKRRLLFLPVLAALAASAVVLLAPAASEARGGPAPCAGKDLVIWAGEEPGGGAAGSVYYRIEFTNLGETKCTVAGYPNVRAVGLDGKQVGAFAQQEPGKKPKVTLGVGEAAVSTLRIVDALNFPKSRCEPTLVAGLKVHVPGGSGAKVAPLAFETCGVTSSKTLSVSPVKAGD